jgi:hypothetical protein
VESPYRIAVIGYGSIPNQLTSPVSKRTLEVVATEGQKPALGNLRSDSPFVLAEGLDLPIRLGRISSAGTADRRITVIIGGTDRLTVLYARSRFAEMNLALSNLAAREGCTTTKMMGYVDLRKNKTKSRLPEVADKIKAWAQANKFDAVIWADLPEKGVSEGQEKQILANDPILLKNTKHYIRSLALPLTLMQQEILNMPET